MNRYELFIFTASNGTLTMKKTFVHGVEPPTTYLSTISYSTALSANYIFDIFSQLKSDSINVVKQMRWIFGRNPINFAANFCKNCGEMRRINFFSTPFTAIAAFHTENYRIHSFSYKNLIKTSTRVTPTYSHLTLQILITKDCSLLENLIVSEEVL